jgi:hypothetical protein
MSKLRLLQWIRRFVLSLQHICGVALSAGGVVMFVCA